MEENKERKRISNLMAQRRFRERQKERMDDMAEGVERIPDLEQEIKYWMNIAGKHKSRADRLEYQLQVMKERYER